jgi:WD40 repeat protein
MASAAICVLVIAIAGAVVAVRVADENVAKASSAQKLAAEAVAKASSAQKLAAEAEVRQRTAERLQHRADLLTRARVALNSGDPSQAARLALEAERVADGGDGRLLYAEVYNRGIPFKLHEAFHGIREFHVDPSDRDHLLVIGDNGGQGTAHNQLAIVNVGTQEVRSVSDYLYLAAAFAPDGRQIFAVAITKYERGPNEGMETKIHQEVSMLEYDLNLNLRKTTRLDTILATTDTLRGLNEQWDIRDIQDIRFNSTGSRIALAGYASPSWERNVSNSEPHHLRSWVTLATGEVQHSVDAENELSSFQRYRGRVVLLDSSHVVVDGIRQVYVVDMDTGERIQIGSHTGDITDVTANPKGTMVAAVGANNQISLFRKDGDAWREETKTLSNEVPCDRVAFFDDDKLAIAREDGSVTFLWAGQDFNDEALRLDGQLVWRIGREVTLTGHSARINMIAVSPNQRYVATASEDRTVRLWSPYEYDARTVKGSRRGVDDIEFSSDSTRLYMSDRDGQLQMFRIDDPHAFVMPVEPESKRRESAISDSSWDEGGGLTRAILREHLGLIRRIASTNRGTLLAKTYDHRTTEWDSDYKLITSTVGEKLASVDIESADTKKPDWEDTRKVLTEEDEKGRQEGRRVNVDNRWGSSVDNIRLQLEALPMPKENGSKRLGRFSPNGEWFLQFDGQRGNIVVWNTKNLSKPFSDLEIVYGSLHRDQYGDPDSAQNVRFSAHGNFVAFPIRFDGEALCILELRAGQVRVFKADINPYAFDIADDGTAAVAGRTGEVYLYNFAQDSTRVLEKQGRYIASVAISADGKWIASGSRDRSVRLWSLETGQYDEFELRNPVEQVLFSNSGTELLAASGLAIHSWYVPIHDIQPTSPDLIASNGVAPTVRASALGKQADNLGIFVRSDASEDVPFPKLVEAALGRPVPHTEEYRRQMLAMLSSSAEPESRRVRAAFELTCLGSDVTSAADQVIRLLGMPTPEENPLAREILRLLQAMGPQVEANLIDGVKQAKDPGLRNGLVYAIGELFPKSLLAQDALIDGLADQNEDVRVSSAFALSKAGNSSATTVAVLAAAIRDGNHRRIEAGNLLATVGEPAIGPLIEILKTSRGTGLGDGPTDIARAALITMKTTAVPKLTAALQDSTGDALVQIIRTLGEIGPEANASRDFLLKRLADPGDADMSSVMRALVSIAPDDASVANALVRIMKTNFGKGMEASFAITRMNPSVALDPLRLSLAEASPKATEFIAYALGGFGTNAASAVPDLISVTEKLISKHVPVSKEVVGAFGKIGPSAHQATGALLKLLQTSQGYDRTEIIKVLGKIDADGKVVAPSLLALLQADSAITRADKFVINSRAIEELRAAGLPSDLLAVLDGFGEFERDEVLFSSLVVRDIGRDNWNRFGPQILKAARVTRQSYCDSDGTWRAALNTLEQLGSVTTSAIEQLRGLRSRMGNCADISGYLDKLAK